MKYHLSCLNAFYQTHIIIEKKSKKKCFSIKNLVYFSSRCFAKENKKLKTIKLEKLIGITVLLDDLIQYHLSVLLYDKNKHNKWIVVIFFAFVGQIYSIHFWLRTLKSDWQDIQYTYSTRRAVHLYIEINWIELKRISADLRITKQSFRFNFTFAITE